MQHINRETYYFHSDLRYLTLLGMRESNNTHTKKTGAENSFSVVSIASEQLFKRIQRIKRERNYLHAYLRYLPLLEIEKNISVKIRA